LIHCGGKPGLGFNADQVLWLGSKRGCHLDRGFESEWRNAEAPNYEFSNCGAGSPSKYEYS
jgi:hypothetical protein